MKTRRGRRLASKRRRSVRTRRQSGGASIIHKNEESKIRVFMCANAIKPSLEVLMKSLEDHKFSYEVLAYRKPWENLRCKTEYYVKGAKAYAKEAGDDALAIFIDGFDCICIQDSDAIYKKYTEQPHRAKIIIGAEQFCGGNCYKDVLNWYDVHGVRGGRKAVEAAAKRYEGNTDLATTEPTFMNTGFIMGPAAELATFFQSILDTPYEVDDQYTTGKWVIEHLKDIDLDLEESFIRNKLGMGIGTLDKLADQGTQEGPGFLHFPGHRTDEQQKNLLERFKQYV